MKLRILASAIVVTIAFAFIAIVYRSFGPDAAAGEQGPTIVQREADPFSDLRSDARMLSDDIEEAMSVETLAQDFDRFDLKYRLLRSNGNLTPEQKSAIYVARGLIESAIECVAESLRLESTSKRVHLTIEEREMLRHLNPDGELSHADRCVLFAQRLRAALERVWGNP